MSAASCVEFNLLSVSRINFPSRRFRWNIPGDRATVQFAWSKNAPCLSTAGGDLVTMAWSLRYKFNLIVYASRRGKILRSPRLAHKAAHLNDLNLERFVSGLTVFSEMKRNETKGYSARANRTNIKFSYRFRSSKIRKISGQKHNAFQMTAIEGRFALPREL